MWIPVSKGETETKTTKEFQRVQVISHLGIKLPGNSASLAAFSLKQLLSVDPLGWQQ